MDLVIPVPGDIWLDANGGHNLVLQHVEENDGVDIFCILALETGRIWPFESILDWNDPEHCSKMDGLPFYRERVA